MHRSKIKLLSHDASPDKLLEFIRVSITSGPSPRKRRRITTDVGKDTWVTEIYPLDYLTIARVYVDLAFAECDTEVASSLHLPSQEGKQVPLALKTFTKDSNGEYHCRIATTEGITLIDSSFSSLIDQQTLVVLTSAAELSTSQIKDSVIGVPSIALQSSYCFNTTTSILKLCVNILLNNSKDLSEGSLKSRKLLNTCLPNAQLLAGEPWSPRDFYDNVFVPDRSNSQDGLKIDKLRCQLYPFQVRALQWLLGREGVSYSESRIIAMPNGGIKDNLPHGFIQSMDVNGRGCFVSHFLGILTTDRWLVERSYSDLKGGILAEEMGLGKTVEIASLIYLHQQATSVGISRDALDPLPNTPATLIVTPPSILRQWKNELHSILPDSSVMMYHGIRREAVDYTHEQLLERFRHHDIVLTTYSVLAAEIHYAPVPSRDLRHQKKYERRSSPLTQLTWWRVVLDEAQMIESGLTNAAKVARLIPRQNAWVVSGTPVRKDARDLLGLLIFLRFKPFCQSPQLWDHLVLHRRDIFKQIFKSIALRHTKEQIKDDLQLPPQKRIIITVPFTQIEEQHYSTLYKQMCDDCGLNIDGSPSADSWDSRSPSIIEKMRNWLTRLRQTCLHPEVGSRNRRALGSGKGPLKTVGEVLEVMVEQNAMASRAEERALLLSQIRRGQLLEQAKRSQDALDIWSRALEGSKVVVENCREQLNSELNNITCTESRILEQPDSDSQITARTGVYRQRLRLALELEHMCTFFVANAYFQIKTNMDLTQPGSVTFQFLDKMEQETYEQAKVLRKELLTETHRKAEICMNTVFEKARDKTFVRIPCLVSPYNQSGIQSMNIVTGFSDLFRVLEEEATQIHSWREKLIGLLMLPLVDEEEAELQGDEFEASTKQQDEVYVYMDVLRLAVADRHEILTGQSTGRLDHDMKLALEKANEGEGHAPQLLKRLLAVREPLKPSKRLGSLRGIISGLRDLKASLRGAAENGTNRTVAELEVIDFTLQNLHTVSVEQNKCVSGLERELDLFKDTMNSRLEYYRQLQQISDTVAPYEPDLDEETFRKVMADMQEAEVKMQGRINSLNARDRYLLHLRDETIVSGTQWLCVICQQPFEIGILTSCGHSYCVECLRLWWGAHRNCPTCKKRLSRNEFHQITLKPKEYVLEEEKLPKNEGVDSLVNHVSTAIYSTIKNNTLNQIRNIDVNGSFGTKIDTLARHIFWIRENDPGAKSVVFSQFKDFLDVLAKAFSHFKIAFTGIDRKDGIQKFRDDPNSECFFIHAKAHSSGLNLVNATHVFLCEPLINTAIELQAIARVHRIGQHQPTTVWMYLVENTVERSIYEISVNRRTALIGQTLSQQRNDTGARTITENNIEAANTLESETPLSKLLTKGSDGGELVSMDDLWDCLFRRSPWKNTQTSLNECLELP